MLRSAITYLTRDCGTHTGAYRIVTLRHALSWWISGYIPGIDADVRADGGVHWFRMRGHKMGKRANHVVRDDRPRVEVVHPVDCGVRCQPEGRIYPPLWPTCFLLAGHSGSHVCGDPQNGATHIAFSR